jgi:GAF domain-containing protein
LGLLAKGMSGADIAGALVLSPETIRTHVRNAMAKLGAATRSQAVVMAMRSGDLAEGPALTPATREPPDLTGLLEELAGLHDVAAAAAYLADDDGLLLRLVASMGDPVGFASAIALGDGPLGRVALDRRTQLVAVPNLNGFERRSMIAAPLTAGGRLVGLLCLASRYSRPTGRGEMLLASAFANRLGEIIVGGEPNREERMREAARRFRTSWAATTIA